jgi:hypothetical protein
LNHAGATTVEYCGRLCVPLVIWTSGLFPGYVPGGEANIPADWPLWVTDTGNPAVSLQGLFGNNHFQIIVSANSRWTLNSFSIAENAHQADVRTSAIRSSVDPNLRPFKQQGGS